MTFETEGKVDFRTFIPVITLPLCCTRGARVRRETGLSCVFRFLVTRRVDVRRQASLSLLRKCPFAAKAGSMVF